MEKSASIANPPMLILAAGLATRMGGRVKPDLPWVEGRTLLQHQQLTAQAAGFSPLAVTRRDPGYGSFIVNPHPERGLAESLRRGIEEVRRRWGPVIAGIMLADQPFVTKEDIIAVYGAFRRRSASIHAVRARYHGVPGHPVFFDHDWDAVVGTLTGDFGLGKLWSSRTDAAWVDVEVGNRPDPSFDIDTDTAYRQAWGWAH